MTRDSVAVAALDDRRRNCPISGASNAVDGASSSMKNGIAAGGSSSSNGGGGDGGSSPKSSSAVSTTTSCCGGSTSSSSSSRSGSDDDDTVAVVRPSPATDRGCSAEVNTLPLPLLQKEVVIGKNGDKDSSNVDATTVDTSSSIGGRLTFYKDGQFIFQLAAHHQQQSYNNQSALTSPCRWVPVPTVIQQHKNNVKSISEWSQHQQNKTIWPYSVTSSAPESKSSLTVQQSQPPVVKVSERKQQQYQLRTTPPPLTPISSAVNVASCTTAVVVATTTNIVRRPSRKCSTTTTAENTSDFQNQNWHLLSQIRPLSKRIQPYQHQSFIMIATKAIKAQRRLLSLSNKQRRRSRRVKTGISRESLMLDQQPPSINLECVVRNLWCRRHTTDLLLRRQLSINHSIDTIAITAVDTAPALQHPVASTNSVDSTCPIAGNGKRRSMFFPLSTSNPTIPTSATAIITDSMSITGSSSPHKKYRLGQQQQVLQQQRHAAIDTNVKKSIPQPLPVVSNNNHSITAILSGGVTGETRANGSGAITSVVDTECCIITSTTTTTTSAVIMPQKIPPLSSPAPLSLLRTLLKNPSGDIGSSPVVTSTNGGYKHQSGSRKRSAVESTTIFPIPPSTAATVTTTVDNGPRMTVMASPSTARASSVNVATAALTALHQLPTIHHPLATTGYFNVLYHQAAMAAAMAYQTHSQLPKSQSPLLSSLFLPPGGTNNSWQHQTSVNRQTPIQPSTKVVGESGVTTVTSAPTIVAPYSSPLVAASVNGSGLLPPATQSPPPPLHLHSPSVQHDHHLHHPLLQQYKPVPMIQKPQFSHHQYKRQQGSSIKQRTVVTAMNSTEYGDRIDGKNVGAVDVESTFSTDCLPLNLSKDSVAENVDDTSTTTTVR